MKMGWSSVTAITAVTVVAAGLVVGSPEAAAAPILKPTPRAASKPVSRPDTKPVAKPAAKPVVKPVGNAVQITDSLVKNLRCASLSRESVLRSLQPDAFAPAHQLPIHNWASGSLAECWSLAHAQRMTFYMARFGQSANASKFLTPKYLEPIEDMFSANSVRRPAPFAVPDITSLLVSLQLGFTDQSGAPRKFKADIEAYQEWRFYQFGNAEMVMGDRERSEESNSESLELIKSDLQRGRMPLVVMRAAVTSQHVVLIKKINPQSRNGTITLDTYDSNFPWQTNHITYDVSRQQFYAPESFTGIDPDPTSAIGLFVVDEDDMDTIQNELYRYYTGRCEIERHAAK